MAVTLDATGTHSAVASTTSFTYSGLTIGAGLTNSAAVFSVVGGNASSNVTISNPQWNGVACTLIGSVNGNTAAGGQVFFFGIVNPASGAHNFTFTSSAAIEAYILGCSFSGVNQTGGATTFANFTTSNLSGTATSRNLVITTAVGHFTLCAAMEGSGTGFSAPVSSQVYLDTTDPSAFGIDGSAAQQATASGTSVTYTATNSPADVFTIAGFDLVAAAGASLVASWYSPFEPPNSLKPRPASFQETQTALSTQAPLENNFPPLFDIVSLLKKQTGFGDLEVPPAGAVRPLPAFEPLPPRLVLRHPGFQENHTNIQTVATPSYQFPTFDPSRPFRVQPTFGDLQVAKAVVASPVTFAEFYPSFRLAKTTAFDDRPAPLPAVSVPIQSAPFVSPVRLTLRSEWQQYQSPTLVSQTPPVFTLSPSFEQKLKLLNLRVLEVGFQFTPQIIIQVAPQNPEQITDTNHLQLPINCILHGQQDYEQADTIIESNNPNYRTRVTVSYGSGGKLSQNDPTFTVKKSNRGYD